MRITTSDIKIDRGDGLSYPLPDLDFASGSKVGIVGPIGSGKTMLIRLLVGVTAPESGKILYDGEEYVPQKNIAYYPQMPYLIPSSIRENLRNSFEPTTPDDERNTIIERMCGNVHMQDRLAERADRLTLDEKRCVAMVRTLIRDRRCILLDSPFETERGETAAMLFDFVDRRVKEMNATLVATYINPRQAMRLADTLVVMHDGKVVEHGPAQEVYFNPKSSAAKRYIEMF